MYRMGSKTRDSVAFAPGLVYILYGEPDEQTIYYPLGPAYKIGMTKNPIEQRLKELRYCAFRNNLQVVHTINVDNMRIVERMFHLRYRDRTIANGEPEWFRIDDKIGGLRACKSIYVNDALVAISGISDIRTWYRKMDIQERTKIAVQLWNHPLTQIVLEQPDIINNAPAMSYICVRCRKPMPAGRYRLCGDCEYTLEWTQKNTTQQPAITLFEN